MIEASIQFGERSGVRFIDTLGDRKDGRVSKTSEGRAVTFFNAPDLYRRESRAYQILLRRNIDEIDGFQIPRLIRCDDGLYAASDEI